MRGRGGRVFAAVFGILPHTLVSIPSQVVTICVFYTFVMFLHHHNTGFSCLLQTSGFIAVLPVCKLRNICTEYTAASSLDGASESRASSSHLNRGIKKLSDGRMMLQRHALSKDSLKELWGMFGAGEV